MSKTILAFGDSNTFGTPPMTGRDNAAMERFPKTIRWPTIVAAKTGWEVIEAGLPGRTATAQIDPLSGTHMNGPLGLRIALNSCGPLDGLVIMLGTNDQKSFFGLDAAGITAAMAGLIAIAKSDDVQIKHGGFEVLLICPPAVREIGLFKQEFFGAEAKSALLPELYADLADRWEVDYLNANSVISVSEVDGVHFESDQQIALGQAISSYLKTAL